MQTEGKLAPGCVAQRLLGAGRARARAPQPHFAHRRGRALTRFVSTRFRSVPRKYPSAFAAYSIIARQEGMAGLWTGVGPNIGRNAIINAAELASYDQARVRAPAAGERRVRAGTEAAWARVRHANR
jgi:hypothetical protein